MKITVIGCGYLGATHAACMAELGHEVLGVEVDPAKRATLTAGRCRSTSPGSTELLAEHVASGRLRFTDSYEEAGAFADLHFMCVGTPQLASSMGADVSLRGGGGPLARARTSPGPSYVVGKSTVPVGTAAPMAELLTTLAPAGERRRAGVEPGVPARGLRRQGHPRARPDRAGRRPRSAPSRRCATFYAPMTAAGTPVVVTDYATAELVKVSANAFLATKISFINAVGEVCDAAGADVVALADAIGHDARIGRQFLNAGVGFGGGCLPKDIRAFVHRAGELGVEDAMTFLRQVDDINQRQRQRATQVAKAMLGGSIAGARIARVGRGVQARHRRRARLPRPRRSPASCTCAAPTSRSTTRRPPRPPRAVPDAGLRRSAIAAAHDADLLLHLTEWPEFREVDIEAVGDVVGRKRLLDGRNLLDLDAWRAAGWAARGLGRR